MEEYAMKNGVVYYPEHWDRELWEKDADLMKETGVKIVRLAEFAWCRMEPEDGVFDFTWLDEAVKIFADRDIEVVLCTPTSCPPLWLYEKHPETIMVGEDGHTIATGIRGHRCVGNPTMLAYTRRIVEEMARHYAGNPAITAWQIDNELEAYFCFCEHCNEQFRQWLREKYGTLEAVNKAYGNIVWSGEYSAWSQIQPPYGDKPHAWLNSAMMLDYCRFASDKVIAYSNLQKDILRKYFPDTPITTNTWFCEHMPDFYQMFEELDFLSYDNYPTTKIPKDSEELYTHAFHLDLMRGVKRKPFWIMEQLSGAMGCWMPMQRMPEPGMIKGYALQAFAHGADTVLQFRWRTANIGAEMHWHGLIDHSNVPGRRFAEFADLCKTGQQLSFAEGMDIKSDVAILFSFENEYAFKLQPQTADYYYLEQLQRMHLSLTKLGLNVDIIGQHEDLSGYRVVIAPEMYVKNDKTVENLHAFARQGGTVILTTRSGVKDENNNAVMAQLPTAYADMAGVHVEEYDPIGSDTVQVAFGDGTVHQGKQWCDILCSDGAEVIARYGSEFFAGAPAITRNAYGKGRVWYIGTVGTQTLYDQLLACVAGQEALPVIPGLPERVEVTTRTGSGRKVYFLFNNDDQAKEFTFAGENMQLAPFEMKVVET